MGNVDAFLNFLKNFDKDNVPDNCVTACEKEYIFQVGGSARNPQPYPKPATHNPIS